MFSIAKEFGFSASHQLLNLPAEHQCARLHGHNYTVIVELLSVRLDEVGFVIDYGELDFIKKYIDDNLDHKHLNDVLGFNPTAEKMAKFLYQQFEIMFNDIGYKDVLSKVSVKETDKTIASYYE
jgi:6-pyruvoyltetrahydropterin/6-carboxytetrahydropterin synthase